VYPNPPGCALWLLFGWIGALREGLYHLRRHDRPRAIGEFVVAGLLMIVAGFAWWAVVWMWRHPTKP
jgi:hypothetical protein